MVARSESMFGCYDSYSYRLWSLANVWNTCQLSSPMPNGISGKDGGDDLNNSSEYYIKCPQCQKGCQTFQSLKEHMENAHSDLTSTIANNSVKLENGPLLSSSSSSSQPNSAISPTPSLIGTGGPFGCSQCTASFATKDQLDKHELLHSPNAQVSCKICNKTFANVYRLQRHMISHDESAVLRKFKCTECDKAFKFKHHLKEHIRIHSGEKPFECSNCGKRFSHSGSYSSHMTSKKCLVMNLKLGRTRAPPSSANSLLDHKSAAVQSSRNNSTINGLGGNGSSSTSLSSHKRNNISPLNNNITTSPNHNSYLPILPKYSEAAAAAFLQSSLASNSSLSPFYLAPPSLLSAAAAAAASHPISPYSMPNLGHIFEQLQHHQQAAAVAAAAVSPHRSSSAASTAACAMEQSSENGEDYKPAITASTTLMSPKQREDEEHQLMHNGIKSSLSECGELVMDEDVEDRQQQHQSDTLLEVKKEEEAEEETAVSGDAANNNSGDNNNGDLEAVKRILATVNATVTKQLLQANMHKFSSESSNDCASIPSIHSPKHHQQQEVYSCSNCKKSFDMPHQLDEHECSNDQNEEVKSEGLAAKLEDIITVKSEDNHNGYRGGGGASSSCGEDQDYDRHNNERSNEDEMDCESVTTTEDGRKVRVRSLISDEQLKVLKDNYKLNPRPKREDLEKIADSIGFSVRVVQVWFQNTRARDRREGRLIQVPYSPASGSVVVQSAPTIPMRYPLLANSSLNQKLSLALSPNQYMMSSEQPLDLSTKKFPASTDSSPHSSPRRPTSVNHFHEAGSEEMVVNLSRKSSQSPSPYVYANHHYQGSNSSEPRQSPSPIDFNSTSAGSRLAQILAQPAHKLAIPGMNLVPMEQLMQLGAADLPSLSQLLSNRLNSLSPNTAKKWGAAAAAAMSGAADRADLSLSHGDASFLDENDLASVSKRSKVPQFVLKSLGSPVLGTQDQEVEGQFSCDQCDKAFSKQSSLARHKYEHSGQRPHKCDECPKAFKHKHHLTEHKRLHSGEKPFQCIKCLKRFSHSGSYSQHMNHRYSYCKPYRQSTR